ncbi:MAG: hypothetical protein V4666_08245 [Bacteroidota bacterium]
MPDAKKTMIKVPKRLLSDTEIETARGNKASVVKTKKVEGDVPRAKGKIVNVQSGVTGKETKGRNGYRVHFEGGSHEDIAPEGLAPLSRTIEYQDYRRGLATKKK